MLQACAIPESAKTAAGPAKRGMLSMGKKKLDCELIGGETLELSDRSQEGHCHVSKISLRFIKDVKVVENPKNSFGVTTQVPHLSSSTRPSPPRPLPPTPVADPLITTRCPR